jgi:hypothetical protein
MKYNFNEEQIKDIVESYKNGESIKNLREKYNVDSSVIKKRLLDNGVKIIIGSPYSLKYWLDRGFTKEEALKLKEKRKLNNVEYWLNKGFSEEEAKVKIKYGYLVNKESFIEKYGVEEGIIRWEKKKQKNIETNKKTSKRRLEYWLSLGYTEDEAKLKRKEHQTTNTIEKYIERHGQTEGIKKYNDRQKKWVKKINNLRGGFNNDSLSVEFFKKKYGVNWFGEWTKRIINLVKYKEILQPLFKEDLQLKDLEFYIKNLNKTLTKEEIWSIANNTVIKYLLNMSTNELAYHLRVLCYGTKNNLTLGQIIRVDGFTFKSKTEYDLYCFFKEKNIGFEYDKNYPNSKRKCDFYIPELDIYVEYMGLYNLSDRLRNKEKITEKYRYIMTKKTELCLNNNLKCLFSANVNEIKKQIIFKYENKEDNTKTN